MKIGYIRVSTEEQNEELQADALTKAGCEKLFRDKASGSKTNRPGLEEALGYIRPGDSLVVWKLDRLGRSLKHLIDLFTMFGEHKIEFISLTESIDTTTSVGKFIFHFMAAIAEFERDLIRERTMAGLAAARARGKLGGRQQKLTKKQIAQAQTLYDARKVPVREIAKTFGVSRSTLYEYLDTKQQQQEETTREEVEVVG